MTAFETLSSDTSKLVYLYLRSQGAATADELRRALDIPLLKLFPVLRTLQQQALINCCENYYKPVEETTRNLDV